jgi:hypothetical protein
MQIDLDNLWFCPDCMIAAVNGDFTGLDYHYDEPEASERQAAIIAGLEDLGPHLVPDFDTESGDGYDEFAICTCDCCHGRQAGNRYRFATLRPEQSQPAAKAPVAKAGKAAPPVAA